MEAPNCIICGTRHWSRQPCPAMKETAVTEVKRSSKKPEPSKPATVKKSAAKAKTKETGAAARKSAAPVQSKKPKAPAKAKAPAKKAPAKAKSPKMGRPKKTPEGFDKAAYQREYMREYRAGLRRRNGNA